MISAIKAQNDNNAKLSQADIDKLDKQSRRTVVARRSRHPAVAVQFLKEIKADNRGLNVGQSDMTSDYW